MLQTPPRPSIMARLKTETAARHRLAESRPLQRSMVRGRLARDRYAAFLGQMYLVHRHLEDALEGASGRHPAFGSVLRGYHRRAGHLEADLAFLGRDASSVEPGPSAGALVGRIEAAAAREPVALLGMLYVLEGSTNGSKHIAASLRTSYGLRTEGLTYLDPHGPLQAERWAAFKRDMDAVEFTLAEQELIIDAAKAVFDAVTGISDELAEPMAV